MIFYEKGNCGEHNVEGMDISIDVLDGVEEWIEEKKNERKKFLERKKKKEDEALQRLKEREMAEYKRLKEKYENNI